MSYQQTEIENMVLKELEISNLGKTREFLLTVFNENYVSKQAVNDAILRLTHAGKIELRNDGRYRLTSKAYQANDMFGLSFNPTFTPKNPQISMF